VSCPYHGWTFDETGKNVAILSEGPDSRICGKPGTEAHKYPTREVRGIVFVWMGKGEPAPIEEDVPEELFDPEVHVLYSTKTWQVDWEVGLEQIDAHVSYLHINAWRDVLVGRFWPRGGFGLQPVWTGRGFAGGAQLPPVQWDYYPGVGGVWPKSNWRRLWGSFFKPLVEYAPHHKKRVSARWIGGTHLPSMLRVVTSSYYVTRWCVPVDENVTRMVYFYAWPAPTLRERVILTLQHKLYLQWLHEGQFNMQDHSVMPDQRRDMPEMLSPHDAQILQWRRLVVTKHFGGRDAGMAFTGRSLVGREGLLDISDHSATGDDPFEPTGAETAGLSSND
jgi:phenylpropionate dioxygenase-like ring-hydroxylating dioxygenase large terminal subunit